MRKETADLSSKLRSGRDDNFVCAKNLSSRPEQSWVCGPPKVTKNISVRHPLSMEPLPFPCHPACPGVPWDRSDCLNCQATGRALFEDEARGPASSLSPWTGAPCLHRRGRGTTWVEQDGAKPLPQFCFACSKANDENLHPASRPERSGADPRFFLPRRSSKGTRPSLLCHPKASAGFTQPPNKPSRKRLLTPVGGRLGPILTHCPVYNRVQ
jgi:hypothetical protein